MLSINAKKMIFIFQEMIKIKIKVRANREIDKNNTRNEVPL